MDDDELTESLARDLDASFEALVRAHADRCYSIALRVLGNPPRRRGGRPGRAVRAYRALTATPPTGSADLRLRPWLATIVVNLCRNRTRRHAPVSTTPLRPARRDGRRAHRGRAPTSRRGPGGSRRGSRAPRGACWRPCPTATACRSCCATSTTCPMPSWPRSSAGPRARSRPRSRGVSRCSGRAAGTELEELTA